MAELNRRQFVTATAATAAAAALPPVAFMPVADDASAFIVRAFHGSRQIGKTAVLRELLLQSPGLCILKADIAQMDHTGIVERVTVERGGHPLFEANLMTPRRVIAGDTLQLQIHHELG